MNNLTSVRWYPSLYVCFCNGKKTPLFCNLEIKKHLEMEYMGAIHNKAVRACIQELHSKVNKEINTGFRHMRPTIKGSVLFDIMHNFEQPVPTVTSSF